jgi:arsenical resistance protein ArsH
MAPYLQDGTAPVVHSTSTGDLNNVSAMRETGMPTRDPEYAYRTLAIPAKTEDPDFRQRYRPFMSEESSQNTDWVSRLELATVTKMAEEDIKRTGQRLRVLVLYGSLRTR